MSLTPSLQGQAVRFAQSLSATVQAVCPESEVFILRVDSDASDFTVMQGLGQRLALLVNGEPRFLLEVQFECGLDGYGSWLAIKKSKIAVYPSDANAREPLFRYEYVRESRKHPAAHVQFHFDREPFKEVFKGAGNATRTARRRKPDKANVQDLHFPVGGHRFRPCLEDVLEMLIEEFGLDHLPDARKTLAAGREQWRRSQLRSVVRDSPEEAATELRSLGYVVDWSKADEDPPSDNLKRFRER